MAWKMHSSLDVSGGAGGWWLVAGGILTDCGVWPWIGLWSGTYGVSFPGRSFLFRIVEPRCAEHILKTNFDNYAKTIDREDGLFKGNTPPALILPRIIVL